MSNRIQLHVFASEADFEAWPGPYVSPSKSRIDLSVYREGAFNDQRARELLNTAATLWFDNLSGRLALLSQVGLLRKSRTVLRVSTRDLLDTQLDQVRWEFFDVIIPTDRMAEALLYEHADRIESFCRIERIPQAVSLPAVSVSNKRATRTICFNGKLRRDNHSALLLQLLFALKQRDPRYQMVITGEFESRSWQAHFETAIQSLSLAENIRFEVAPQDLAAWYADKDVIIQLEADARSQMQTMTAMACGVRPIIHHYFGAGNDHPGEIIFASLQDAVVQITDSKWEPQRWRATVDEAHNVERLREHFRTCIAAPELSDNAKVSILLPTYNRAAMLRATLRRLKQQSYPNIEIVAVDDCSPDETPAVLQDAAQHDSRIVVVRNEVNKGNAEAMATAAAHATGEFVLVFSDDDDLADDAVEKFVECYQRKQADVIYCDLEIRDADGKNRGVWRYRSYYDTRDLLQKLLVNDGNLIPETFFCRRELYRDLYQETYSRRFINTYYLPHLRRVRMIHLPLPLYRYTVHSGSTFSSALGLLDRSKSTQNYINTMLFMYSPMAVLGGDPTRSVALQYADACIQVAELLLNLGDRHRAGRNYVGATFKEDDNLWWIYYHNAFHWLSQAKRHGCGDRAEHHLSTRIAKAIDPDAFDPELHANLPEIYRELPWFAHKAFNNLGDFVALDLLTVGSSVLLNHDDYTIWRSGKAHLRARNYRCYNMEEAIQLLESKPISVINLCDPNLVAPILSYLIENGRLAVNLVNLTGLQMPALESYRNLFTPGRELESFRDYLKFLTEVTTRSSYAHTPVEAAV